MYGLFFLFAKVFLKKSSYWFSLVARSSIQLHHETYIINSLERCKLHRSRQIPSWSKMDGTLSTNRGLVLQKLQIKSGQPATKRQTRNTTTSDILNFGLIFFPLMLTCNLQKELCLIFTKPINLYDHRWFLLHCCDSLALAFLLDLRH